MGCFSASTRDLVLEGAAKLIWVRTSFPSLASLSLKSLGEALIPGNFAIHSSKAGFHLMTL